jgi:hypothetical protein
MYFFTAKVLTLSNPIFLPPTCSAAVVYFGREGGWWITCGYPAVLKEKSRNRKSKTCSFFWLMSVLHEEKRQEQENHDLYSFRFCLCFSLLEL